MEIWYNGTNITQYVTLRSCIWTDTCGDVCDSLDMVFENASGWYGWDPMEDDRVRVTARAYDTGEMFLKNIQPEDGAYRILATALPCAARRKENRSFRNQTIEDIVRKCGVSTGMGYAVWGIEKSTVIPYIEQNGESAPAFLDRFLRMEGAALKCVDGKYTAIGIKSVQEQRPARTVTIMGQDTGVQYVKRHRSLRGIRSVSPYANVRAEDDGEPMSHPTLTVSLPARDGIQAARWARGLLLWNNREDETLTLDTELDTAFTALAKVKTNGPALGEREWVVHRADHDLIGETSTVVLLPCVYGIR